MFDAAFSTASSEGLCERETLPAVTLVLGGVRSGKSRFAQALVERFAPAIYLATAEAGDDEMAARIREHQARRDGRLETVEEPLALGAALAEHGQGERPILVDCLTLWLSNLIQAGRDIETEFAALDRALTALTAPVVFVSNEVGLGIVPDNPLARQFRDHAGRLNQRIAAQAGLVIFIAAGLPLVVKSSR
ncbi:MAG: bifunctional adenosylcobinamide kinase/adenosylcobinamide-phosphate guanylyltransferase [Alphaproteobacteria bacterium]